MPDLGPDWLTPIVRDLVSAGTYELLVVNGRTPGRARELLTSVTPDQLLTIPVTSPAHAFALPAGLWLWHDALHECHEIAQKGPEELIGSARYPHGKAWNLSQNAGPVRNVENDKSFLQQQLEDASPSLNFWHAIMHRREGDFSNAKYWYARCRNHPALADLGTRAAQLAPDLRGRGDAALERLTRTTWDPDAFVDLVARVHRHEDSPHREVAVRLQRVEWAALFDHCIREAGGGG